MTHEPVGGRSSLTVKAHNRRALLVALLREQPISRVRLARTTGLSTTTVTNLVAELAEQGVITEAGTDFEATPQGAGRRPRALELVPNSRYAVGIHIGVRRIKVALCNLMAQVIDCVILPLQPGSQPEPTLARVTEVVRAMLVRNGLEGTPERLAGVGVGASGLVDVDAGVNVLAPNLGWHQVPVRTLLADALDLPVTVDNNVRCMALAESLYGAGVQTRALAFVYARIGVGAGLVVDGQVYRGAGYGAGEIGHWVMMAGDAHENVSLEALISERKIVELVQQLDPDVFRQFGPPGDPIQAVFTAARGGHPLVKGLLDERAYYLGIALANLVDVLNPQLVLLGGFLHDGFDLFYDKLTETVRTHAFGALGDKVQLQPATFGTQCGEIGAAALGFDEFFLGRTALA